MLASFAEYDRENIAERTRAGLHRAFRAGKYMGRIPYGYRADEEARLVVVPEEAAVVREIMANVVEGSTLYAEAKRLNDLGLPSPGIRYGTTERKPGRSWSATTLHNIVHQRAYSGVHEVKFKDDEAPIERVVPALIDHGLQEQAKASLQHNKRYRDRKRDRNYLLAGLVKCAVCGYACTGHSASARGKKYHYYRCTDGRSEGIRKSPPHRAPFLNAGWLEELVWSDVRRFLENPGETLERVRAQLASSAGAGGAVTEDLAQRHRELQKRLANKQAEKDRYVKLYAQDHISEEELATYLLDLKNQIENLRLLIGSVEVDLSHKQEQAELAETTHAWLLALRQRLSEVEMDTEEGFRARRRLVRLLVAEVKAGEKREDGSSEVRITYRFDPPDEPDEGGAGKDVFVGTVPNGTSLS
jgi:site-specific DNA recombinase